MSGPAQGPNGAIARVLPIPAPTGGWNALDALDQMAPQDAVVLDNWFPDTAAVRMRRGSVLLADTGTGKPVYSLLDWYGLGEEKLLAASGGALFEVSSGIPAQVGSGFSSDVWEHTLFATLGGAYAIICNGSDVPQIYDGSKLSGSTFASGSSTQPLDPRSLVCPVSFIQRVWFIEKGTLRLWYSGTGEISGNMSFLDLGPYFQRGGELAGIATWNKQLITNAIQEQIVCVSTNGEVLTYSGTDPSQASTFGLSGHYFIGRPVAGYRSMLNTGPDLVLITEDGFEPVSKYLTAGQSVGEATALSTKIGNAVTNAVRSTGDAMGWCAILYPAMNSIWFNIPQADGTFQQYVQNVLTGAWCRFIGMNGRCWRKFVKAAVFGTDDGKVMTADVGTSDDGTPILADCLPAYRYAARGQICRFVSIRPVLQVSGPLRASCEIQVDYQTQATQQPIQSEVSGSSVWGTMIWGAGKWSSSQPTLQRDIYGASAVGYSASPRITIQSGTITAQMNSIDVTFEAGGFV
jgi:hypothetical protein